MEFNKFLRERAELIETRFMEHVRDSVKQRLEQTALITKKEWDTFNGNSYERKLLHPLMDNECLINSIEYYYSQTGWRKSYKFYIPSSYNDAIQTEFLPMLIERFKLLMEENKKLKEQIKNLTYVFNKSSLAYKDYL
jgi:hypothetical protein